MSISKADNTAFTNKEYLYYLNFLNLRNITLNLRVISTTKMQRSSEFLQGKTGKIMLLPRETPKLDVPSYLLGKEEFKTGSPGADFYSRPRPAEVFKGQSCVCLVSERKEKSQGENCFLLYPGMNSVSSGLLASVLAVLFHFTGAGCSLARRTGVCWDTAPLPRLDPGTAGMLYPG